MAILLDVLIEPAINASVQVIWSAWSNKKQVCRPNYDTFAPSGVQEMHIFVFLSV